MIDCVSWTDRPVPVTDDGFIHVLNGGKRTADMLNNVGVAEVSIGGKEDSHRTPYLEALSKNVGLLLKRQAARP